jgi:hypothetical protein
MWADGRGLGDFLPARLTCNKLAHNYASR